MGNYREIGLFTLLAPDLLRADSPENIYLEAEGLSVPITVTIKIQNFRKTSLLLQDSVTLNLANGFHALKTIQLPSDSLNREETTNKFVNLKVTFGDFGSEERPIMVSFHSGYIFIQTDKPIYNPGDKVQFRAYVSSPTFKAFDTSIIIDIKNPNGVVVKQISRTKAAGGVYSELHTLSEFVNEGTWTITAKFDDWQQNTFKSQFEVKKYVLPAFNVTITPKKPFLSLDDSELVVEISARYLYGEPVQGTAYVVFGVMINHEMRRLPSVKQVSDLNGGVVRLNMDELKKAYPDIRSLIGSSVYVKASVLTNTGSDLVEGEKTGIKIVSSPYVLFFKDMPKYFKPGLPLDLTIQVNQHDGSPAGNVQVKLNLLAKPVDVYTGTTRVTVNMPKQPRPQTIIVETTRADLRPEQQAKHQVTVVPYRPFDTVEQNYLHISTSSNLVSLGARLPLELKITTADVTHKALVKHITYLVLNKGKIIIANRVSVTDQLVTSVSLMVTPEMMPSFRFVAFYVIPWAGREEVVSDSVWIDVPDTCIGGLKIRPVDGNYKPRDNLQFQIRGDPGAKVSLAAVDNAVYLLNRDRLTQKKIWDVVEHGDIGCTRGGGGNALGVFTDAGLLYLSIIESRTGSKTETRQALQCPGSARRRRSALLLKRKAQLESHYKEKLERRCCKDGLRDIRMPYTCTRRSLYITEGWECMRAFRYCCATYRGQVFDPEMPTTPVPTTTASPTTTTAAALGFDFNPMIFASRHEDTRILLSPNMFAWGSERERTGLSMPIMYTDAHKVAPEEEIHVSRMDIWDDDEEEIQYLDEADVALRSKFYESWLWTDVNLPSRAGSDGLATTDIEHPLPDSITEWGILAISASPQTGFCVADPYNVKAWQPFFVDLRLPHSVARNEQVEIKAVIHNYSPIDMHVRVVLKKTDNMCSVAFKDRHTQELDVPARSSKVVPYTIVPLVVGKLPLEVMVLIGDLLGGDRIEKSLRVVMEGVQKTEVKSFVLNPSAEGGTQTVRVGKTTLESVVPNSVPETFINVRGNVLADSVDNSISKDSLASLIRMPGGCVEQNLASITLPLIALLYLDRSNSWESVGVDRRAEAVRYIQRGYENQLAYKKKDGSYPPYKKEGASTWITAYVVKVFSMAYSIGGINKQEVCEPLVYLVNNKFRHEDSLGTYVEHNPVYSTTMMGGLRGGDPQITLTAFVQIALAEAKKAKIECNNPEIKINVALHMTQHYLTRALIRDGRRPYTVAIAAYALSLHGMPSHLHDPLMQAAAPDGSHWPDSENPLFTLEATGYALLALIKLGRMDLAEAPFKWLNSQRRQGGGYGSTQSTMVVLQALSEYLINRPPPPDMGLDVDVMITGRRDIRYHFDPKSDYAARSSRLPPNLDLEVRAQGNGEGILEVVTYYNQLHEVDEKKPCQHFDLSVNIKESSEKPPVGVEKSYQIIIKVRALGPRDVRMVVLDINLPTGFTPENSDLEMLSNSVDHYISNFQIVDNLSDRGSLIIHLFKVSHKEPEILIFRLQQNFKVGILQPSSVNVYEYYNPDRRCTRTYSPRENRDDLTQICRDNVCRCTQGDCCIPKTDRETFLNKDRETFACKSLHHVFKVKVLSVSQSYYDKYEMEITQVIKLGVEAGVQVGHRRLFMSHISCREGLHLKQGSHYLLMGPRVDQWTLDRVTNSFIYMLGKDTWVERWPSPAECSSNPTLRNKCRTLNEAADELSRRGCRL
ncbi:venom factor-like [Pholidichthys leucotaenia]